ncbi:hypothetical protein MNV_1040004 [Candidatus Methanoperedens nitroreducens]|uniref:Uncharacterized protein n=1 Tax=Candidatus Methanoperedens nitratireducens TaxID=1392998 RepID=A0A284VIC8_9EURY|nr:hypothetical protein MNV_1040004 [Candidatus Methanoperedens nitroreducens]
MYQQRFLKKILQAGLSLWIGMNNTLKDTIIKKDRYNKRVMDRIWL